MVGIFFRNKALDTGNSRLPILWAPPDLIAPTITSTNAVTLPAGAAMSLTLTADEPVTWSIIGGADQSKFTLTGNVLSMPAKSYLSPTDADSNNVYVVTVRATDRGSNTASQTINVTVVAEFVLDTFTDVDDTPITSHTGERGAVWTVQNGYTPTQPVKIKTNMAWSASGSGVYAASGSPPTADYYVEVLMSYLTTLSGDAPGIFGRGSASANTFYFVQYARASQVWQLRKTVSGGTSTLASSSTDTFGSGTRTVRLIMNGSAISVTVDGVSVISTTDTSITAAGFAGIRFGLTQSSSTGIHFDTFSAGAIVP